MVHGASETVCVKSGVLTTVDYERFHLGWTPFRLTVEPYAANGWRWVSSEYRDVNNAVIVELTLCHLPFDVGYPIFHSLNDALTEAKK